MLTFNILLFVKNVFPIGKYQLKVKKKTLKQHLSTSQPTFTFSKSAIETPDQCVKSVQS